jgi:hypothetical protein
MSGAFRRARAAHLCSAIAMSVLVSGVSLAARPPLLAGQAVDIGGTRLGMDAQAAITQANARNPRLKVLPTSAREFALLPKVAFVDGASGEATQGDDREHLILGFTMPPGKAHVWHIRRIVQYAPPNRPNRANVIAALREKYGPESGSQALPGSTNLYFMYWAFDRDGRKVADDRAEAVRACREVDKDYLARLETSLQNPPGLHQAGSTVRSSCS